MQFYSEIKVNNCFIQIKTDLQRLNHHRLISSTDCPLYTCDYKYPKTASPTTMRALGARPRSSTIIQSLIPSSSSSMPPSINAINNVTPAIGNLNILNPILPNVSSAVYYPKDNTQPPSKPTEVDKNLLTDALHNLNLHNQKISMVSIRQTPSLPMILSPILSSNLLDTS